MLEMRCCGRAWTAQPPAQVPTLAGDLNEVRRRPITCHARRVPPVCGARFRVAAARGARAFAKSLSLESRGSRECRVHAAPTALRANEKDARRPTQVRRNHSGTPCAMVLRLTPRSPWCTGLFSPIASPRVRPLDHLGKLDPSVGGTGPHGLTVRIVPHVLRRNASIAARTTNRDDRETPLMRAGWPSYAPVFRFSQRRIFLRRGLDVAHDL